MWGRPPPHLPGPAALPRRHQHGVPGVAAADLVQRAVEHVPPVVDQQDAVAQLFHLVHLVGGHEDRRPPLAQFAHQILDQLGVDRVEGGKGLVDDDQFRLVQDGVDDLRLLLHALAQLFDLFALVRRQVKALQVRGQPLPRFGCGQPLERGQVEQAALQRERPGRARAPPACSRCGPFSPRPSARPGSKPCPGPV